MAKVKGLVAASVKLPAKVAYSDNVLETAQAEVASL